MDHKITQVIQWIQKHHPEMTSIPDEIDLIEQRLIDSLRFTELVFLLEQLSGKTIDIHQLHIDDFRTLASISARFLTT